MAGVVEDMEEKGEMKREKVEEKEESLEKVRVEHSLEGDFQFLPNELTLHNPDQVISFFAPVDRGGAVHLNFSLFQIQVKSWTCDQCTLENENENSLCAACAQPRKVSRFYQFSKTFSWCLIIFDFHHWHNVSSQWLAMFSLYPSQQLQRSAMLCM